MRWISLLSLFLVSCATFRPAPSSRHLASLNQERPVVFKLSLDQELLFANGANSAVLKLTLLDASGNVVSADPRELQLLSDAPLDKSHFASSGNSFEIDIRPLAKSPHVKLMVLWKDQLSPVVELKTTLHPLKEKLKPLPPDASLSKYVADLYYTRQDNFTPGLFEGFAISNHGKNAIVSAANSKRDFDFEFGEHARQNISLMVSDAPNGTVSHTMHSHFMFFPRNYLPFAEAAEGKTTVTLPTGEKIVFAESGEIIDGVFTEGPVDVGPDRFKRQYADIKYQGRGILLRANARGQMPQQGQFESTSIDMDYGIKYSNDVLILNGATGERCRRPKKDFWPADDVSPILFKFPTDEEFNEYLKAKCNFSLPELDIEVVAESVDAQADIESIWSKCSHKGAIKSCLKEEAEVFENASLKNKVYFELIIRFFEAKKEEAEKIESLLATQTQAIKKSLLTKLGWISDIKDPQKVKQDCLDQSVAELKDVLKFHNTLSLIRPQLSTQCSSIREEILAIASREVARLQPVLEADFSWSIVSSKEKFISDCQQQGLKLLDESFRYRSHPHIYRPALELICTKVEASAAYQSWLKTQSTGLEAQVLDQVLMDIESIAESKAQACLQEYPMDTQLNRLRYKKQREACLTLSWNEIEEAALERAQADPMVKRVGLSFENINKQLILERRKIQLRVIKKYFL